MCYQEQCFRKFTDRYVFGRHLQSHHIGSNRQQHSVPAQTTPTSCLATQADCEVNNDISVSSVAVLSAAEDDGKSRVITYSGTLPNAKVEQQHFTMHSG